MPRSVNIFLTTLLFLLEMVSPMHAKMAENRRDSRTPSADVTFSISIVITLARGGSMTWHGTYAANGLLDDQTGNRSSPYGANGKWEEPGGLINDGYRYRDRHTETFLTRDPAGFIDGPNTYNYVRHNPWSAFDPNGLATSLQIPTGTQDIGYSGPPSSISTNPDAGLPPMIGGIISSDSFKNDLGNQYPDFDGLTDSVETGRDAVGALIEGFHPETIHSWNDGWHNPDGSIKWGTYVWTTAKLVPGYVADHGWKGFKEHVSDPQFVAESALGGLGMGGLVGGIRNGASRTAANSAERQVLYHYTNEAGHAGILESQQLNPSLKALSPNDVRYGNGQYLSDIVPGSKTPAQLSRDFLNQPFQGQKYTHFLEIDVTGLGAIEGRPGVWVVPNETPLDLTGRILNSGKH